MASDMIQRARKNADEQQKPEWLKQMSVGQDQAESRPDYFAGQGRIDVAELKKKFKDDIMNNLKLAQKMGVFNILRDMHYDAKQMMVAVENQRLQMQAKSTIEQPQFPGYEERLD